MKIVKPLTLGLLHRPYRHRGADHLAIAALGFFELGADHERLLTENIQWPAVLKSLPAGTPLDEVMPKQRGEFLLAGHAFAPGGKPVTSMQVSACVAGLKKTLRVYGDRRWSYGLLPRHRVTAPEPFVSMPLAYERAYGGPRHAGNPLGRGHTGGWTGLNLPRAGAMPNLEYPDAPVGAHLRAMRPACFEPIDLRWTPRCRKHGSFDKRWLKEDAPGLARDVDWSLFNTAPEDQWLGGYFAGGEAYRLEGMHPERPLIEGRLPAFRARAFLQRKGSVPGTLEEAELHLDTVWFFPEHALGVLVYHGRAPLADSDALDVASILLAYERKGEPRSIEHYRRVHALRLDPSEGALHAFNESQLAPARSAAEQAARDLRHREQLARDAAKRQAMMDELLAEHAAQTGMTVPPAALAQAQAQALPLEQIPQQDIDDGDFDMAALMRQARQVAEQARADGERKLAELGELAVTPAAPVPDTDPAVAAARCAAALARAARPAPDLQPGGIVTGPVLDEAAEALLAAAAGALDPAGLADLRAKLAALPALERRARNAALTPVWPKEALAPLDAAWLGQRVAEWQLGGAFLAGRDLAGADLRGQDFRGADLREALFEQADLSGACFEGADLRGAVFCGARIDGADFSGARLAGANFCATRGEGVRFQDADLSGMRAIGAAWPYADLRGACLDRCIAPSIVLDGAVLDGARLTQALLIEAAAAGTSWRGAYLEKTVLLKAGLAGADFAGATLVKAVLMDAVLAGSGWRGARLQNIYGGGKADWSGADLSAVRAGHCGWHGASMAGAVLAGGEFLACDFGQCDMSRATLDGALLARSLFMRTGLAHASARGADFFQALCRKADFRCADLREASLAQAECSGAVFTHALLDGLRFEAHRSIA